MASLFRAGGERGAGGKLPRGYRRGAPPTSPYARPSPAVPPFPPPPPPAESQSPSWLLGLISGAGKLISAVFRSDSDESSQPTSEHSEDSSDGTMSDSSKEDEDSGVKFQENDELNQIRNKPESVRDGTERALELVPKSDTKIAIEQLLMQETFSRDEYNKLTKMIQSRVVDFPSTGIDDAEGQRYLPNKTSGSAISFPGAWQSTDRYMKLTEASPYSVGNLNALSPGPPFQAWTPDLRDKAVMEAKQYLVEKRLGSSSKACLDCGPCTLNTDMLCYDIGSEVGSPVDMAKSYIQSLPPWRSPSLSSTGFKSPPPSGMHLHKDEPTKYPLPSLQALKRSYLAVGSHEALDETHRVRTKPTTDILVYSKSRRVDSTTRLSEHRDSKLSSAFDKSEFCDENHLEINHQTGTDKVTSFDIVSEPGEALKEVERIHETRESSPEKMGESQSSDADVFIFYKNQVVKDPSQTKEQNGIICDPHGTLIQASTSLKHAGGQLSEAKMMQSEDNKSIAQSDHNDASNQFPITSSVNRGLSSHLNKDGQIIDDSTLQDGISQPNGSRNRNIANGSLELNTNLCHVASKKGEEDATNSGKIDTAAGNAEGSCELDNEATGNVLASHGSGSLTDKAQNGTRMRSIERMLAEPQPSTTRRGRKRVVKSRRGR